jgi:hypothetical protein
MRIPAFIGGSYPSQSIIADGEVTMNWYPELLAEMPGRLNAPLNRVVLYPTPGQQAFVTVPDIGARGFHSMNNRLHAVIGMSVREVFATKTTIERGRMAQDGNPAQMAANGRTGNQLLVCSGGTIAWLDLATNVLTALALPANVLQIGAIDGFGLAFVPTTGRVYVSDREDFSTWDPTQFLARSTAPDPWTAMISADRTGRRELWLIGEHTGEVYYESGRFPVPFDLIPGSLFNYGTLAPWSLAAAGDEILWLSHTYQGATIVVAARGYTPQRISTHAVEAAIATYQRTSTITDAEAFTYQDQGHNFYVLRFPTANATWVCDRTTGLWHQRGTWVPADNRYALWRPRVHAHAFGQHLVGESGTGQISVLDTALGTEADGSAIRRQRITPALFGEHRQFPIRQLEVFLEAGLGTRTGQGAAPRVALRNSDDGGKTWSIERTASAGRMGAYGTRVRWTRLGRSSNRVFEVTCSDPIPWRLMDAFVNHDV